MRIELAAGGSVGLHPAATEQVLIVVSGSGRVKTGALGSTEVVEGDVVRWEAGEKHETTTDTGLVALVVEAPGLQLLR